MIVDDLIEKNYKQIYNYALQYCGNRLEAEDATHDAIVKVLKKRDSYNKNRDFIPWVRVILRNAFIDKQRKKKQSEINGKTVLSGDVFLLDKLSRNSIVNKVSSIINDKKKNILSVHSLDVAMDSLGDSMYNAIHSIPKKNKGVFILRVFNNYSFGEISEILGMKLSTARHRFFEAKSYLEEIIYY